MVSLVDLDRQANQRLGPHGAQERGFTPVQVFVEVCHQDGFAGLQRRAKRIALPKQGLRTGGSRDIPKYVNQPRPLSGHFGDHRHRHA